MASTRLKNTFASTYKDDFRDSDNYHRILFNSGRALQARELTQMQTIIQREIERFGSNVLKPNSVVKAGLPSTDKYYKFIKLNTTSNTVPANYETSVVGTTFSGPNSKLNFTVLKVVEATGSDPWTLYVDITGGTEGESATTSHATPGENLSNGSVTLTVQSINTVANPAVGDAVRCTISEGAYFVLGHFVFSPASDIILSKYSQSFTGSIGYKVEEKIITASDDTDLYDNTGSSPNLTSPGADRYQIVLTFTKEEDLAASDTFCYAGFIDDGEVRDIPSNHDDLNSLSDLLAEKTRETSGNYIVSPFSLNVQDSGDNVVYNLGPGLGYVNGYRSNVTKNSKISLPKPTITETVNNEAVGANYGYYFEVDKIKGVPDVNTLPTWNLRDSADYYGGSDKTIGTARVKHVERTGSTYKYYLMDVNMSGSNNLRNAKSIGVDSNNYANFSLQGISNKNVPQDTLNNNLIFPLPRTRPSSLTDVSLTVQRRFATTTNGSGNAVVTGLNADIETWADTNLWTVTSNVDGTDVSTDVTITGAGTSGNATITGTGLTSEAIEVLAYVNVASDDTKSLMKTKTLTEANTTGTIESDGSGFIYVDLGKTDIYDVQSIRKNDASGVDYSASFTLDNGQRDNFYDQGRLVLNKNFTVPNGSVYCAFRHFVHDDDGGDAYFFSRESYRNEVDYADIPAFRQSTGEVIQLRDVLDFRSTKDNSGANFTGSGASVSNLPRPSDIVSLDATYFLPRKDLITLRSDQSIEILKGVSAENPILREPDINMQPMFEVTLNPNYLNDSDLSIKRVKAKTFTMKEIGRLEDRVKRLEETTSLSLLELDTKNLTILDSDGAARTKSGFLVDNFKDFAFSSLSSPDYRAAVDFSENTLSPQSINSEIRLIIDSDASVAGGVVRHGDLVTLPYTDSAYVSNTLATRDFNVNQFNVRFAEGSLTLSPASDTWIETKYEDPITIDGGTVTSYGNTAKTWTDTEILEDQILETSNIPFMRSRKIYFKAEGLKPNQQHFAFFDRIPVADWIRESDGAFRFISEDSDTYGNTLTNATGHPDGSSTLISNADGVIEGTFFIPSTDALKIRTGTVEFLITNVNNSDPDAGTGFAESTFTAEGTLNTSQQTVKTTRYKQKRRTTSNDDNDDRPGRGNNTYGGNTNLGSEADRDFDGDGRNDRADNPGNFTGP